MKTYKELYSFPLKLDEHSNWVWDSKDNFVFQFIISDEELMLKLVEVINEDNDITNSEVYFEHKEGRIYLIDVKSNDIIPVILIRGWGGLTSTNKHGLSPEEALNVQNTFAEFIVEKLNKRYE